VAVKPTKDWIVAGVVVCNNSINAPRLYLAPARF